MPETVAYEGLLIAEYRIPSITAYNRLEASPRTENFDRSLKAEIRDAMWMLTRQWQFGEFKGEDAASPVTAQILGEHTIMNQVSFLSGDPFPLQADLPLETHVEREAIKPDLFLAVQMGRYFFKLMRENSLENFLDDLIEKYPLTYLIDANDIEAVRLFNLVKNKIFDGYNLYIDSITPDGAITKFETWLNAKVPADAKKDKFKAIAVLLKEWHNRNYSQPVNENDTAWIPSQLEYQFSISSSENDEITLTANQYYEGHLDWYSFDINYKSPSTLPGKGEPKTTENFVSFLPSSIAFKGMPNPRYWMLEENETDFGKIDTTPTGLLHLMLAEFGLIYSNDWFMLPYPLNINTLCEIKGIVVTDVFGQEILIRPAGKGDETNWHRWAMFHNSSKQNSRNNTNLFYLVPAITKSLESLPLEQVNLLRDEMANMVWAVENVVPSQSGKGVKGDEMALVANPPSDFIPAGDAAIRYVLGTTVPANWTPFIPVHVNGSDIEIRFQRARMPGAKPPYGVLLKEQPTPYFINEEEVPRSGVIVNRTFQKARWLNGKSFLWRGRAKQAGKGEGWSNLKFDQIEDINK